MRLCSYFALSSDSYFAEAEDQNTSHINAQFPPAYEVFGRQAPIHDRSPMESGLPSRADFNREDYNSIAFDDAFDARA
jgi:hypothetical protein